MTITRRDFVKGASFAVAAAAFAQEHGARVPIAFSSLGCPDWELKKILDFAAEHGYAAIELRGLQGNLDLPSHPAFAVGQIEQSKSDIASHKLQSACVSSSTRTGEEDPDKRAKEIADGRRF